MISARVAQRCLCKLGDNGEDPAYIFTELRVGYQMPRGRSRDKGRSRQRLSEPLSSYLSKEWDRMPHPELAVVTGAFSYTGRYVTRRLLDDGVRVRTLTRNPDAEDPFASQVEVAPLDFSDPDGLRRSMQGAGVFYNTYWIRYARGRVTFDLAVENTRTLFKAAERAGLGRIVHFSVTKASSGSGLPYFRGKAQVEDMLVELGIPYAIIRLTLVFGVGDLLLNNMAWALRLFPVFPVYGNGDYPVQPVYVEDLAAQAVQAGSQSESSAAAAAGPDTFSFEALLRLLASSMGVRARLVHTPPSVGLRLDRTGWPADARHGAHP